MPYFRFPPTQNAYCCCNPCSHLVKCDPAQPTSYTLTLSGLMNILFTQGQGVCDCNPNCPHPVCIEPTVWEGSINWNGAYVLENCTLYGQAYGCLDLSYCEQTACAAWTGYFNLPASLSPVATCCAVNCSCSLGTVWYCIGLTAFLRLFLPPCVTSPSDPITASWRLDIWPYIQTGTTFSNGGQPCPGAPTCCPGAPALSWNDFIFFGSSTFTGALQPDGSVMGVAPLPSSWTLAPGGAQQINYGYTPGCPPFANTFVQVFKILGSNVGVS